MTIEAAPAKSGAPTETKTDPYAWYVVAVLTLVYTFNFVDRQIIGIVSPAIKEELGLSDSMLGLLKGLAFAVLYTTLGVPIAWAADRWNRVNIIAISLTIWSAFTALSGLAANAMQLALARVGVGIGEAGGSPPSHSIISDYFPKEKRSTALSVFSLGIPFGQMLAFLAGGWVLENLGWRKAFFVVGVPGIILAIVLKLTVREPVRGAQDNGKSAPPVAFIDGAKTLLKIPSFWGLLVGATAASFTGYGVGMWAVDFYRRTYEISYQEITVPLGLLNGVAYGIGTYLGGMLTDKYGKKNKGFYALIPAIGMAVTIPVGIFQVWAPTHIIAFVWAAPFLIGLGLYLGPTWALVQTLAPANMRAFAVAFMFFVLNLIALGLAPLWVGALSDYFASEHGEVAGLRFALTSLAATSLIAVIAYYWTSKKLPADWAKATGEVAG